MKKQIFVMPAWMAGIQVRKDASGDIHVSLDSSARCWNDPIEGFCLNTDARPPVFSKENTKKIFTGKNAKGDKEMETTASQVSPSSRPQFSGMSHVSLPCRDLEESKIFYAQVMGGELVHEIPGFVEYRIEDIIVGLSEQSEGWTAAEAEYPHYAFYISGSNFELMKNWLDRYGVPNYPYRRDDTALMYFRDPSGNLFELYCDTGYQGIELLPLAPRRGGRPIDFRSLNYRWRGQSAAPAGKEMPRPRF